MKLAPSVGSALVAALALCSCTHMGAGPAPLRVGITANYAPMVFRQDNRIMGLEIDLAYKLGRALGRPVEFVELDWEAQIQALIAGQTDIIMSGMSVTDARKVRIAFSDPWLEGGLMAVTRAKNAANLQTKADVLNCSGRIGVVAGTTAETFVQRQCKNAHAVKLSTPDDAWFQLQRPSIDLFVHDLPSVIWQVSKHESELTPLLEPLNREQIAWGIRRTDPALIDAVNSALATWKADGTLDGTIRRWIPYYDKVLAKLNAEPAAP